MNRRHLTSVMVGLGVVVLTAAMVSAAAFLAIVTPSNPNGWAQHSTGNSNVQFVNGPDIPPAGLGSLEFRVDQWGRSGAQMRLSDPLWSMPLAELGSLQYWTFVQSGKHCDGWRGARKQAVYVALDVALDGDDDPDDTVIFEPPSRDIGCRTWQEWDAKNGLWRSVRDRWFRFPRPLAAYIAAHPDARILHGPNGGGVRLVAGFDGGWWSQWGGFIGNADLFTISRAVPCTTPACLPGPAGTYDFEAEGVCVP